MLEVSVLGSVRASTRGKEHPIGGSKQRGLLARLVVSRGRSLSAERLIDELWDELPPRNPGHALQARVSRLRSAVPIEIEWSDGGYRIDPSDVQTDAARFEHLYHQSGVARSDGDLDQATEHLTEALDLWRGQAFEGLLDITALRAESVRLEKLWTAALSDRIALDLAAGRCAEVISELHSLIEEEPFAERHWSQLMTALYCDGRPQEALDAFARARSMFAEHLGVEPSGELSRLHRGILQEQAPSSLLRLPSVARGIDLAEPTPPSTREIPRNLTSNQPDALALLLREHRALLLTGPHGSGKTHLLRAIRARFEVQGHTAVLLSASPLSHAVPLGIFAGILPERLTTPAALIDHFTRNRTTTPLLVDNVDHLDDASLFVISQLLRTARVPMILSATGLAGAPDAVRSLYDSGDIVEVTVDPLSASDADELTMHTVGGCLTPESRPRIFSIAQGNPLHLREILTASIDEGRLVRTDHGWELRDEPATTTRLTQLVSERFAPLDESTFEAAVKIAIAGEYPASALESTERRMLARSGIIEYSAPGWLRLSHPLDREHLRTRCSRALWTDLSHEVLSVLSGDLTAHVPAAQRRAHVLALDIGAPIEIEEVLSLAEHALGAFDERLARRAASAVIDREPDNASAHRVAALAASALGDLDDAARHFDTAGRAATTSAERTAVALAHAQHLGLRHHDAPAALTVIEQALDTVDDADDIAHLERDAMRWAVIAGQTREIADAPGDTTDAVAVVSLMTAAMSGVITGPLDEATRILTHLEQAPAELIALIPGGAALIELTATMALSNTGDVTAAERRLEQAIARAHEHAPETLGTWEYALGFSKLLAGEAEQAYAVATSAVGHLKWRDTTGLLPAAIALSAAAALVTGRADEARTRFDSIPDAADSDPKVVMLRAWAEAWREGSEGRRANAASRLVDAARWLLTAQHTYFAGILAHCAVRVGADEEDLMAAIRVLDQARTIAGGGLLEFFMRHAAAVASVDHAALAAIAHEAETLGMAATSEDTMRMLGRASDAASSLVLWSVEPRTTTPARV